MDSNQEAQVERMSGSSNDESAWWRFFQLLISGMQDRPLSLLKLEYYPCRVYPVLNL